MSEELKDTIITIFVTGLSIAIVIWLGVLAIGYGKYLWNYQTFQQSQCVKEKRQIELQQVKIDIYENTWKKLELQK